MRPYRRTLQWCYLKPIEPSAGQNAVMVQPWGYVEGWPGTGPAGLRRADDTGPPEPPRAVPRPSGVPA